MSFLHPSYIAGIGLIIVFGLWLFKQKGGKFPLLAVAAVIAFVVFTVKTCRELDEEERMEQLRSEQIRKRIEAESDSMERHKRERLKEITIEEYIKELNSKKK